MRSVFAVAALAVTAGIGVGASGPARAAESGPSCVGQIASANAGPRYGLFIASVAHATQPFGLNVVSQYATSEKTKCPST